MRILHASLASFASALLALLVACGGAEPTGASGATSTGGDAAQKPTPGLPAGAPDALGPYGIGVTTLETTDGEPGGRTLPVEIWYPAVAEGGADIAHYQVMLGVLEIADIASPLGARRDAPADLRGAPHPTVIFSHGSGGVRFQSVYLTEYLASHGFVVAAPDHIGNTFHEEVDKSLARSAAEMARLRPIDVSRTLDLVLARAADHGDPLGWMADASRVGVAGHSFGGFTSMRIAGATIDVAATIAYCQDHAGERLCDGWESVKDFPASARDERFKAALPQAPGGAAAFGATGFGDIHVPTMIQAGTSDQTTPFDTEAKAPFGALASPAYLLAIQDAGHFTFSDMCLLVQLLGLTVDTFNDGCGAASVDPAVAHAIIDAYATAFLQVHVAGEGSLASFLTPGGTPPPNVASYEVR